MAKKEVQEVEKAEVKEEKKKVGKDPRRSNKSGTLISVCAWSKPFEASPSMSTVSAIG